MEVWPGASEVGVVSQSVLGGSPGGVGTDTGLLGKCPEKFTKRGFQWPLL